ncbi:MAG: DUF4012 domain-containing protein [Candidatus Falkowbacteria bacterium]|nr:DUF4012 domain-containing protein [Candidatus Falkowbacteria bacterium]
MNRYLAHSFNVLWFILKYALIILIAGLILLIIALSGAYKDLRAAGEQGLAGKNDLTAAVGAVKNQDWETALTLTVKARSEFGYALASLDASRSNPAIKNFGPVRVQINDLEYLLKTADILSRSLERGIPIASELKKISAGNGNHNFIDLPAADKGRFLKLIYESEPELNGLKANLDLARLNLDKIHKIGVLWPVYSQISDIKQELTQVSELLGKAAPLIKLLPALAGYPVASRFLIILQNNDELRPTGGFIGVYGIMESRNGEIISIDTDDSYHLDMPASLSDQWKMEAPAPLKKYLKVEKWYLRDSNWSPDWPTAAAKVAEIYHGENAVSGTSTLPFTGVVAITPDFIGDLLRLVGPIVVRSETYDANNFQPLLQYNVEVAYKDQDISSWDRKDIVNELMGEIKSRLFKLSADKWSELIKIADSNIAEKNIQVYFPNSGWQGLAKEMGMSGEVKKPAGDYLMVVDANLGAFKSDAVLNKDIFYTLNQSADGLNATVRLDYRHEGGFDWRTTRYRSYTRVYAPLGSHFISLKGVNESTADISVTDDPGLNKTVFGFFWTIEPGSAESAILSYNLPDRINVQIKAGAYELLVQRQAGSRINSLKAIFKPLSGKTREWSDNLNTDKYFTFN